GLSTVTAPRVLRERALDPILGTLGESRDEHVFGAEVVRGEPAAHAGAFADAGERCAVHTALTDELGGRVEKRLFRPRAPFCLRARQLSRHDYRSLFAAADLRSMNAGTISKMDAAAASGAGALGTASSENPTRSMWGWSCAKSKWYNDAAFSYRIFRASASS